MYFLGQKSESKKRGSSQIAFLGRIPETLPSPPPERVHELKMEKRVK